MKPVEEIINELSSKIQDTETLEIIKQHLEFYKGELDKAIVERDKQRAKKRQLMAELEEKERESAVTAIFEKKLEDLKAKLVKDKLDSKRRELLEAKITQAAKQHGAYNPSQVAKLLFDQFQYDADLNEFYMEKKKQDTTLERLSVEQAVKSFLQDSQNANLVKSSVNTGGTGHKETSFAARTQTRKPKYSKEQILKSEQLGLTIQDYIEIEKLRKRKLYGGNDND
ncbi:MAG: hypothetical protein JRI79_14395 [Deltaproteobacteria bacterium]|nr:hypothetical protein [Deltaproteobacteria bacterium]MBW1979136.1 hypothetical protein [Deltaproteobacteria bacterium]MBW2046770.1 hypothetical protein [Deltaproteobacteria bacterium]MBW2301894.1 hypothetical protein [Deltaproteobacteria bacterium]